MATFGFARQKMKQSKAFYGHKAMGIETIQCHNLPTNIGSKAVAVVFFYYLFNIFCIFLRAVTEPGIRNVWLQRESRCNLF